MVDESNSKITCDDLLILSCEEDYKACIPYMEKGMIHFFFLFALLTIALFGLMATSITIVGILVYSSELLLNGIVIQKLEYNRYVFLKENDIVHLFSL